MSLPAGKLTEPFAISRPENPPNDKFYVVQKHLSVNYYEARTS